VSSLWYFAPAAISALEAENSPDFGFIDRSGIIVLDLRKLHKANPRNYFLNFSDGYAACTNYYRDITRPSDKMRPECSFLEKNGSSFPGTNTFFECKNFNDGLAEIAVQEISNNQYQEWPIRYLWRFLDLNGIQKFGPYVATSSYSEGLAGVLPTNSKYWQFIDKSGNVKINGLFDSISPFAQGRAAVCIGSRWGLIDAQGKLILSPSYSNIIRPFHEGLAAVEIPSANRIDYLDREGKVQLTVDRSYPLQKKFIHYNPALSSEVKIEKPDGASYSQSLEPSLNISEGLVVIEKNGKFGYSDFNGRIVIAPIFDYCWPFAEGRGRVYQETTQQGLFGYVDRVGKQVIPCRFTEASDFSEGYAVVLTGNSSQNQCMFVDRDGNNAFKKTFSGAQSFSHGLAFVGSYNTTRN